MKRLYWHIRFLCALVAVAAARAEDRALLIGINDYVDQRVRDLRGCEDDVAAVRQMLIDQFGFKEAQIKVLLSRSATRAAILEAFQTWLIDGTQAGDRVVFFDSSHGSQTPDKNGDEADGRDEALCPADYDPEAQANALLDDELHELLQRLAGRNVTLLIDSCHSGTITKSVDGQTRGVETINTGRSVSKFIPPPTKDIDWVPGAAAPVNGLAGSDAPIGATRQRDEGPAGPAATGDAAGLDEDAGAGYVAFSACSAGQVAEEVEVDIGGRAVRRGAFTWFLVRAASEAARDAGRQLSNRDLLHAVRAATRDPRFDLSQTPELTAGQPLAGQTFLWHASAAGGRVMSIDGAQVRINLGAQQGVQQGQEFVVLGDDARDAIGRLKIEDADQLVAIGRAVENRGIRIGQRIDRAAGAVADEQLAVFLGADRNPVELTRLLEQRIRAAPDCRLQLVSDQARAALYVQAAADGPAWSTAIYSRYGTLRSRRAYASLEEAAAGTLQRLLGEQFVLQLASLEDGAGDIRVTLAVEGSKTSFVARQDACRRERLRLRVRVEQDCYLMLLSVDSAGELRLLLPNKFMTDNAIHGGVEYLVPPAEQEPFEVLPPAGRDVVKAIASKQPFALKDVNTKSITAQGYVDLTGQPTDTWRATLRAIGVKEDAETPGLLRLPATGWGVAVVLIDTVPE